MEAKLGEYTGLEGNLQEILNKHIDNIKKEKDDNFIEKYI